LAVFNFVGVSRRSFLDLLERFESGLDANYDRGLADSPASNVVAGASYWNNEHYRRFT